MIYASMMGLQTKEPGGCNLKIILISPFIAGFHEEKVVVVKKEGIGVCSEAVPCESLCWKLYMHYIRLSSFAYDLLQMRTQTLRELRRLALTQLVRCRAEL